MLRQQQGCIIKRGRSWAIKYRGPDGKQKWETVGPRKKVAAALLVKRLESINSGRYVELRPIRFQEYTQKWLEAVRPHIKPRTWASYRSVVESHLEPHFGFMEILSISRPMVKTFIAAKCKDGKLEPKTVGNILVVLHKIFEDAIEDEYLAYNPAHGVRKPIKAYSERTLPSLEDVQRFLVHATPEYIPLFLTVLLTGMRRGEVLGLQWRDIDWKRSLIWVRRSLVREPRVDGHKGKLALSTVKSRRSARAIIMPPALAISLQEHSLRMPGGDEDLLFRSDKGKPLDPDNFYKREFLGAIERAGVRPFKLHDLRHLYGSLLREEGADIKLVQQQMGHASIQTTLDVYGHLVRGAQPEITTRLEEVLLGPLRNSTVLRKESPSLEKGRPN